MNEETAKFKEKKRSPAPDPKKGKLPKKSGRKPWTIEAHWKRDAKFEGTVYFNPGEDGGLTHKKFTIKELEVLKEEGHHLGFSLTMKLNYGPFKPGFNFATKEDAMESWKTFVNKGEPDMRANYYLVNKQTGLRVKLRNKK